MLHTMHKHHFLILAGALVHTAPFAVSSAAQNYPARQFPTGAFPQAAVVSDVDSEGKPDVLVANRSSAFVSFIKNLGFNFFAPGPNIVTSPTTIQSLALNDINGDGFTDIILGGATILQIIPGFGVGTFGPAQVIGAGGSPVAVATGNFNGDAFPDILVASSTGNIAFHAGLGAGVFAAPVSTNAGLSPKAHASLVRADFNGDFLQDAAVANFNSGNISIFTGSPAGFSPPQNFAASGTPWGATAADLNLDGTLDVVSANRAPAEQISILPNSGGGAFQAPVNLVVTDDPLGVAVADPNQDGIPDILVIRGNINNPGLSLLTATSPGTYGAITKFACGSAPNFITVSDLNADGAPDVVVTNTNQYAATILFHEGQGFQHNASFPAGDALRFIATGDINSDGVGDLATANTSQYSVSYHVSPQPGIPGAPTSISTAGPPQDAILLDMNADTKLDLLTSFTNPARVAWFPGNGTGTLGAIQFTNMASPASAIAAADYNSDGTPDVAAATLASAGTVTIFTNPGNGALVNFGTVPTGASPGAIAASDANSDGAVDLLTAGNSNLTLLAGSGTGNFAAPSSAPASASQNRIATGDINLDGVVDVCTSNSNLAQVYIYINNGLGVFAQTALLATGTFPNSAAAMPKIADVNHDGLPDVICANGNLSDGGISVFYGNGAGIFTNPQTFASDNSTTGIRTTDADIDGDLDVVGALERVDRIAIFTNLHGVAPGVASFGAGTPGCAGVLSMKTNTAPAVNTPSFAFLGQNLPLQQLILLMIADAADAAGSDYFSVNLKVHLNPLAAVDFLLFDAGSNDAGQMHAPVPIPNDPLLGNRTFFSQLLTAEKPSSGRMCSPVSFTLISSEGLQFTIAP